MALQEPELHIRMVQCIQFVNAANLWQYTVREGLFVTTRSCMRPKVTIFANSIVLDISIRVFANFQSW